MKNNGGESDGGNDAARQLGPASWLDRSRSAGRVLGLAIHLSAKRQSAHTAELVPGTVVMAAYLTGSHRTGLR